MPRSRSQPASSVRSKPSSSKKSSTTKKKQTQQQKKPSRSSSSSRKKASSRTKKPTREKPKPMSFTKKESSTKKKSSTSKKSSSPVRLHLTKGAMQIQDPVTKKNLEYHIMDKETQRRHVLKLLVHKNGALPTFRRLIVLRTFRKNRPDLAPQTKHLTADADWIKETFYDTEYWSSRKESSKKKTTTFHFT